MDAFIHLIRSFGYALRGIGYAVRTQQNLRIHLVALIVVVLFNAMAGLSVTHWCIEILCCMLVIALELVNTALEAACDKMTRQRCPQIGHAKDAAAGAVLVAAIGSVVIAVLIFYQGGPYQSHVSKFLRLYSWVKWMLPAGAAGALAFIFLPSILQKQKKK